MKLILSQTMTLTLALGAVLGIFTSNSYAQKYSNLSTSNTSLLPSTPNTEYYTFDESSTGPSSASEDTFTTPLELMSATLGTAKKAVLLLNWMLHSEQLPTPTEPYQRVAQFGRWINDPTDDTCMNTRAKVLVRDSGAQVTFRNNRNCVVDTGYWVDPYAGQELKQSREIQIDHVVPLKHAYLTGAWKWDFKTRCLYANFMGANFHLLSVSGHENMSKGDRAPDAYIPPEESYRCEYLQAWLKVKAIWRLAINKSEAQAIQSLVKEANCQVSDFKLTSKELSDIRNYIQNNINYCALNQR